MSFVRDPRIHEALVSAAVLAGSYLVARSVSWLLGRALARAARRTSTTFDDRLLSALKRPLTYTLFLIGAWAAIHRLPGPPTLLRRLDTALVVLGVLLVSLALLRGYAILLHWYTTQSKAAQENGLVREFEPLLSKLGYVFIVTVAAIAILQRLGVNVASLVVSLGVGSLAVGLAAQDTLANMFAGFVLMLDRPFKIGDRIRLSTGEIGDVETIGIRATRIRTFDETVLVVPNAVLVKDRVVNQSQPTRHITTRVEVGVAYGSDLALAKRILAEAALASDYVDRERTPVVLITKFAEFSVNFLLIFWARDYTEQGLAASQVHEEIERRFREAGIEIPYPVQQVIHQGGAPPAERKGA